VKPPRDRFLTIGVISQRSELTWRHLVGTHKSLPVVLLIAAKDAYRSTWCCIQRRCITSGEGLYLVLLKDLVLKTLSCHWLVKESAVNGPSPSQGDQI
jgi:hypothetical protein